MDLCLVRHARYRTLVPATDLDLERLARLPRAQPFEVQLRYSRNSKLMRWYRGLVGKVAEAIDVSPDALHNDLKLKAGLVERALASPVQGLIAVQLRSTAGWSMEDPEFNNFVALAVELIFRDYLPHVRAREKQKLIMEWVGRQPSP